jgi:hypothetical protein
VILENCQSREPILPRFRTLNTWRGRCIHTGKPLEHLCWCFHQNGQQARMMLICGPILGLIGMDMYLFPRELDFDARRTGLISKQDKIIASNTYDHPEFRSKVSVKVKIRTWGRGARWGTYRKYAGYPIDLCTRSRGHPRGSPSMNRPKSPVLTGRDMSSL